MIYTRLIMIALIVLMFIYYVMVIGQLSGWWKITNRKRRIINAIKYIFGYRSRYGHFDEFIFQKKDAHKLVKIAKHLDKNVLDNKPQEPENSPSPQGGE